MMIAAHLNSRPISGPRAWQHERDGEPVNRLHITETADPMEIAAKDSFLPSVSIDSSRIASDFLIATILRFA